MSFLRLKTMLEKQGDDIEAFAKKWNTIAVANYAMHELKQFDKAEFDARFAVVEKAVRGGASAHNCPEDQWWKMWFAGYVRSLGQITTMLANLQMQEILTGKKAAFTPQDPAWNASVKFANPK